jgi:hypothetical protein
MEQNLYANEDVFAFVRSPDGTGCSADHDSDRLLIVVNKAQESGVVDLPLEETALAGCAHFQVVEPAAGAVPALNGGKLHIEEPAESITVFEVH